MKYITGEIEAYDPLVTPPPSNTKLNLITKYGIQTVGIYDSRFHIAWYPLLKIPKTVKERMRNDKPE